MIQTDNFLTGFIKRASEYGFTKDEAIFVYKKAELSAGGQVSGPGLGGGTAGGAGPGGGGMGPQVNANPLGLGPGITSNPSFNSRGPMNLGNQPLLHNGMPYNPTSGSIKWPAFLRSVIGSSPGMVQQMETVQPQGM